MSIISKLLLAEVNQDLAKLGDLAPEDRQPWVIAGVQLYQELTPTAFENVELANLSEQEVIDEIVPVVAAGLVVLETLGEEAQDALFAELREQAQYSRLNDLVPDEPAESFEVDGDDEEE